jgi:hypothetical protein
MLKRSESKIQVDESQLRTFAPLNCAYKTHIAGFGGVKDCQFKFVDIPERIQDAIRECTEMDKYFVIIPAGTILYRGSLDMGGGNKVPIPWVEDKRFGWFTSTLEHQNNINYTRVDSYKVVKPLLCVFEANLHSTGMRGNQYYPSILIGTKNMCELVVTGSKALQGKSTDLSLDGYVGCDECEVGLTKDSIIGKLRYVKLEKVKQLKYID